jgi:CHAT domain-containing protein
VKRTFCQLNESRTHFEEQLKIIESLRTEVVSRELRASFFATVQGEYEFYVDLLMQLHRQEPGKNHHAAALHAIERSRARSLLESLTEARADIRRGVDPDLLARERSLQQRLNTRAEELLKLSASGAGEARLAASKREVDALTNELQQVQTQIRQTSPRYAALTQPQPLTLAEIQQQALDADTLLLELEYSLGAERSFLWAVTPATANSYELPKRVMIEAAAQRVYDLLIARSQNKAGETGEQKRARVAEADRQYPEAAAQLSQMLLAPAAQQLGKKRLMIVADGMLNYLPFGALPDPNYPDGKTSNPQPLVVEHEIVNQPSASTVAVLRRELKDRKPSAKALAVIADPVFARNDERIKAGAPQPVVKTADKRSEPSLPSLKDLVNEKITRKLVQQPASGELQIARLPFTRQEAEGILKLVPTGEGTMALDFAANRALVESDKLSQYRIVHFATHGLADSERAELSTIVLSLFDEQGRPLDGFLRAHEIYNLNLPAEMVVLSACETGLGKLTRGEGLVSLTRGFMYAGAARVVVSLWSVGDQATAELMTKFYRRVLVGGERPAAALRAAQIEMWRTQQWEAPYYWAAFTLQGEWR